MLRLSKHFIENWRKRVGTEPETSNVNDIISQSVRVQKGKKASTRFDFIKTLTIYWHADLSLVITVDHFTNTVVSIYSQANMAPGRRHLTIGEAQGY